ncbi:MAG: hypothetical protein AB7N71_12395, partial [Phycisphaerae bacterium]
EKSRSMYRNDELGFAFRDPLFHNTSDGSEGAVIQLFAPAKDNFSANINVVLQPAMPREAFLDVSKRSMAVMGMTIADSKEIQINGRDALEMICTGKVAEFDLKLLVTAVMGGNYTYLITGTALETNFSDYEANFRRMIESFQLKAPE